MNFTSGQEIHKPNDITGSLKLSNSWLISKSEYLNWDSQIILVLLWKITYDQIKTLRVKNKNYPTKKEEI